MMSFIVSHLPWFWVGVLVLCLVIEAATMALTTVWAAIAALPLIFLSMLPVPFKWQLLIFAVLTLALAVITRPFAVKKLKVGEHDSTNVNALEGQEVLLITGISRFEKGEAKAKNGVVWTATSGTGNDIPEKTVCIVLRVEGNNLVVAPKDA
ncbi:MAG: NfeD family protein [Treponemataceae bacterium]|nr:NfeD family protein [Treponemataceae bacterium]